MSNPLIPLRAKLAQYLSPVTPAAQAPVVEPSAVPEAAPAAVPPVEPSAVPVAEPAAVPPVEPSVVPVAEPLVLPAAEPAAIPGQPADAAAVLDASALPAPDQVQPDSPELSELSEDDVMKQAFQIGLEHGLKRAQMVKRIPMAGTGWQRGQALQPSKRINFNTGMGPEYTADLDNPTPPELSTWQPPLPRTMQRPATPAPRMAPAAQEPSEAAEQAYWTRERANAKVAPVTSFKDTPLYKLPSTLQSGASNIMSALRGAWKRQIASN